MNYSRVSKLVEGSRTQQDQVEYKTVAAIDVQSDVSPQAASLKPTVPGSYRLRATSRAVTRWVQPMCSFGQRVMSRQAGAAATATIGWK